MAIRTLTRRESLVRAAAAAAGIGLAASLTTAARRARAEVDPPPDPDADNTILNALLAAEYNAIATYTAGAGIIAGDDGTPQETRDLVTDVAVHFQQQHQDHAAALAALIAGSGGNPIDDPGTAIIPASFPAAPTTTDVIKLAADKEKAAAFTYAQVLQQVSTQTAAKLVASIGGVEAQHFVVLYLLAEGLIAPTDGTAASAALVVPASFVLDVGLAGSTNLEDFPALDALLALDAA